ncbi:MAG TPA: hypothetical protein VGE18_00375 [Candidatus Paceibacterota bacterium]
MKILLQKIISTIIFSVSLCVLFATPSSAATLSASAAQQQVYAGDTFAVEWFLDTENQSINLIDAVLTYSSETLEVIELSTGVSSFTLWPNQPYVLRAGTISLTGGIPAGITGARVRVLRTVFRATAPGTATIATAAPSQVLLNDGIASARPLGVTPVVFEVLPGDSAPYSIYSTTHPLENVWYKNTHVEIDFTQIKGEEYSYSFSTNAELIPDAVPDKARTPIVYDNMPDGVYYFTLASRSGGGAWHEARVFRVQIDTQAPEFIDANIATDESLFEGKAFATFAAVDKTSGIEKYAIKSGWFGTYKTATTPFELRRPIVGDTTYIRAIDRAGNVQTTAINFPGYSRPLYAYVVILLILIIVALRIRRIHS